MTCGAGCNLGREFCRDRLEPRVVRGGSFINNDDLVRCAYRNRNGPGDRNNNVGFRVVSHGLHPTLATREGSVFSVGYGWRCANEGRCSRILAAPGQPGRASMAVGPRPIRPRLDARTGADPNWLIVR